MSGRAETGVRMSLCVCVCVCVCNKFSWFQTVDGGTASCLLWFQTIDGEQPVVCSDFKPLMGKQPVVYCGFKPLMGKQPIVCSDFKPLMGEQPVVCCDWFHVFSRIQLWVWKDSVSSDLCIVCMADRHIMKVFQPRLVWKTGLLLRQGAVDIMVQLWYTRPDELGRSCTPCSVQPARWTG